MCTCTSCKYTDSFSSKGFAEWPRGNPKGPAKARAEYASHVSHLWAGVPRQNPKIDYDATNFYGVPKGSTRAQVAQALNAAFERTLPDSAFTPFNDEGIG